MKQDTVKGIILCAIATFFVVSAQAFGKVINEHGHHPIEIAFYMMCGGFILSCLYIITFQKFSLLKTTNPKAHIIRSLIGNLNFLLFFWAVTLIPLTTATAIHYVSPILVTFFSITFLKEHVDLYKWVAVVLGFLGAFILVQPSGEFYSPLGITIACFGVVTGASVAIILRKMGLSERPMTTSFYFFLYGVIFNGALLPFVWTSVPSFDVLLGGFVLCGFISLILRTIGYCFAPASALSPVTYLSIVWATLIGYFVWEEIPTLNVVVGTLIVILCNLITLWREQKSKLLKE